jgi:hypothetical protein
VLGGGRCEARLALDLVDERHHLTQVRLELLVLRLELLVLRIPQLELVQALSHLLLEIADDVMQLATLEAGALALVRHAAPELRELLRAAPSLR